MSSTVIPYEYDFQNSYAFLIGINSYDNEERLSTPINDVCELHKVLETKHSYDVKSFNDVRKEEFRNILQIVIPKTISEAESKRKRILFYFAGHGKKTIDERGEQHVGYFMPADGRTDDLNTLISFNELLDTILNLKVNHCLIILDCCYAGGIEFSLPSVRSVGVDRKTSKSELDFLLKDPAWQIIVGAGHDEIALDRSEENHKHSPFANKLLEILNGDPQLPEVITATSLYYHLRDHMSRLRISKEGFSQIPQLFRAKIVDHEFNAVKGEYIFLNSHYNLSSLRQAREMLINHKGNPWKGLVSYSKEDGCIPKCRLSRFCLLTNKVYHFIPIFT